MVADTVNQICFNYALRANWDIKELKNLINSNYNLIIQRLTIDEILTRGLYYSKRNDYFDKYLRILARKNGNSYAYSIFKKIFPKLNSIDDLYNYCFNVIVKKRNLKEVSEKIGITIPMIKYYAGESKIGMLPEDQERLEKRRQNILDNYPGYYEALKFLLEHDNKEEIIEYFLKLDDKIDFCQIKAFAISLFPEMSIEDIEDKIIKRYSIYRRYRDNVLRADSEARLRAREIVSKFINGDYNSIRLFCEMEDMKKSTFRNALAIIKNSDSELYQKYSQKIYNIVHKIDVVDNALMRKIVEYIAYGYEGRKFTILDYLKMTKISVVRFFNIVELSINDYELQKVRLFCSRYRSMQLLKVSDIMNERREINCQLDDKNMPIPNSGHVVTPKEKKEIIARIKQDGYELYDGIYTQYLNDFFQDEDSKIKKKTR